MIGWLLLVCVVVAIVWDETISRHISNSKPKTPIEHWDIGVTVPKKYNSIGDEWYDPNLPFWKDED